VVIFMLRPLHRRGKSSLFPLNRRLFFSVLVNINKIIIFNFLERLFEQQLEEFLRSVLENGLPGLGIPPLDPIAYEGNISIGEINIPGVIK
jgi:hypothetical protein